MRRQISASQARSVVWVTQGFRRPRVPRELPASGELARAARRNAEKKLAPPAACGHSASTSGAPSVARPCWIRPASQCRCHCVPEAEPCSADSDSAWRPAFAGRGSCTAAPRPRPAPAPLRKRAVGFPCLGDAPACRPVAVAGSPRNHRVMAVHDRGDHRIGSVRDRHSGPRRLALARLQRLHRRASAKRPSKSAAQQHRVGDDLCSGVRSRRARSSTLLKASACSIGAQRASTGRRGPRVLRRCPHRDAHNSAARS